MLFPDHKDKIGCWNKQNQLFDILGLCAVVDLSVFFCYARFVDLDLT